MKVVGDSTADGQTVFALGMVQLTLPPGAAHFYPLGGCSRCGEVIAFPEPILSTADLDLGRQPHLCQNCARTGIEAPTRARTEDDAEPAASDGWSGAVQVAPGLVDAAGEVGVGVTDVGTVSGNGAKRFSEADGAPRPPAGTNGAGGISDQELVDAAAAVRSAIEEADEIRAEAERAASQLLDDAHRRIADQQAALTSAQEDLNQERDRLAALRAELDETVTARQQQLTLLVGEAQAQAEGLRSSAEADAARIREAAERELADAAAIRSQAESEAAAPPAGDDEPRVSAQLAAADEARSQAAAMLASAQETANQHRRAAEAVLDEAHRQATAVLAAAEAEAARLYQSAAKAAEAAEAELEAAIALHAAEGSRAPGS